MAEKINFDDAMKRLAQISADLEREDLPLEIAIELFEEGLELSKKCQDLLAGYENRVKELVDKHSNKERV